jgi:SAM-dependent methyltransferase
MIPKCWNEEAISHAKEVREIYLENPSVGAPLIRTTLGSYPFYHNIEVAPGIKTAGMAWTDDFVRTSCELAAGIDFEGNRVLDIGCRDGAMSLYAESRGAAEVYAADNDASPGLTNFIVPFKNSIIKPIEININDLDKANLGRFDVIFCCGLVYHLQAPFWGLRQVRDALSLAVFWSSKQRFWTRLRISRSWLTCPTGHHPTNQPARPFSTAPVCATPCPSWALRVLKQARNLAPWNTMPDFISIGSRMRFRIEARCDACASRR